MKISSFLFLFGGVPSLARFVYLEFNDTTGLNFVGSCGTSNCYDYKNNNYGDRQGYADKKFSKKTLEWSETDFISETTLEMNNEKDNNEIDSSQSTFLHRSNTRNSPTQCKTRARLTPSLPSQRGGLWYKDPIDLANGFDTYFTFQITDHSKECVSVRDQYFSQKSYKSCFVHGGDGFAFVIQNSINGTSALGEDGGGLGFAGIENSLAVAFDTWQNHFTNNVNKNTNGQNSEDENINQSDQLSVDNVSIHSNGFLPNSALAHSLLSFPRPVSLSDGEVHLARLTYFTQIPEQYLDSLSVLPAATKFMKDQGDNRGVGMLCVWLDDSLSSSSRPLLALPISLPLSLSSTLASVGFTASTGKHFHTQDILSWTLCEGVCSEIDVTEFDYHQSSRFSAMASARNSFPGLGFGGDADPRHKIPLRQSSPDTKPERVPLQYFAEGQIRGLATDEINRKNLPPHTKY